MTKSNIKETASHGNRVHGVHWTQAKVARYHIYSCCAVFVANDAPHPRHSFRFSFYPFSLCSLCHGTTTFSYMHLILKYKRFDVSPHFIICHQNGGVMVNAARSHLYMYMYGGCGRCCDMQTERTGDGGGGGGVVDCGAVGSMVHCMRCGVAS